MVWCQYYFSSFQEKKETETGLQFYCKKKIESALRLTANCQTGLTAEDLRCALVFALYSANVMQGRKPPAELG